MSQFKISELLHGNWYLDRVEIIGLNNNDTSKIVSIENRKTRIQFESEKVKLFPDTTGSRFYKPVCYEFDYEVFVDTITNWTEIKLLSKKKKYSSFRKLVIVDVTFNHLVYETFDSGIGLETKRSRTRYYYVKDPQFRNPFLGRWMLDKQTLITSVGDHDSIYNLFPFLDSIQKMNVDNPSIKCEIEFTTNNAYGYSCHSLVSGVFLGGKYMLDLEHKKLLFISKELVVYDYKLNSDDSITLKYDPVLTSHYSN